MNAITTDLLKRVEESKTWYDSQSQGEILVHQFRKFETTVELAELLDSPKRVERYGLGFTVKISSGGNVRAVRLNIRVKPETHAGKKEDSTPYVISYIVDPTNGSETALVVEHQTNVEPYTSELTKLSIQDWYKAWLNKALKTERSEFIKYSQRVGE